MTSPTEPSGQSQADLTRGREAGRKLSVYELAVVVSDYTAEEIYGRTTAVDFESVTDSMTWGPLPWNDLQPTGPELEVLDTSQDVTGPGRGRDRRPGRTTRATPSPALVKHRNGPTSSGPSNRQTPGRKPGRDAHSGGSGSHAYGSRGRGRSSTESPAASWLLPLSLAAVLVVLVFVGVRLVSPSPVTVEPMGPPRSAVSSSVRVATPTTDPTSTLVDCSAELGGRSYCQTEPECWSDLYSYADMLSVATPQDCKKSHVYQTFAQGVLDTPVNRQPSFEARQQVRALCSSRTFARVLPDNVSLRRIQIVSLPPQVQIEDDHFRCLFSTGERTGAQALQLPR